MTEQNQQTQNQNLPPVKIAFVIDGSIVDVLHTDERLGAIFLSDPTILDVTEWMAENPNKNLVNGTWDGQTITPVVEIAPTLPLSTESQP